MLIFKYSCSSDFFYVRNHLPVPEIDLTNYNIELAVEDTTRKTLSLDEIKKYPKYTITSAIQCGGNRRSEMAEVIEIEYSFINGCIHSPLCIIRTDKTITRAQLGRWCNWKCNLDRSSIM